MATRNKTTTKPAAEPATNQADAGQVEQADAGQVEQAGSPATDLATGDPAQAEPAGEILATTEIPPAYTPDPAEPAKLAPASAIAPTIGRKVWFWPTDFQRRTGMAICDDSPCDATVIFVHPQGTVNLRISDHAGSTHIAHSVELLQGVHPERNAPEFEGRASWMPYQAKQAAKG